MSKAVLVVSYDQPEETQEALDKLQDIAQNIRGLFKDQKDVLVHVAIRETADEVLNIFSV
jgi:hypothetical protein